MGFHECFITTQELIAHSMYVVYIDEAFKFIPREQFLFKTTDEYSSDTVSSCLNNSTW